MPKEKLIEQEGIVIESLPNVMFRVQLDCNNAVILCQACGKMRQNYIKVIEGDKVLVGTGKNSKDGKNGGKPPMRMF